MSPLCDCRRGPLAGGIWGAKDGGAGDGQRTGSSELGVAAGRCSCIGATAALPSAGASSSGIFGCDSRDLILTTSISETESLRLIGTSGTNAGAVKADSLGARGSNKAASGIDASLFVALACM